MTQTCHKMEEKDKFMSKLVWMNTMFTWWTLTIVTIILLSVWVQKVWFQVITFLLVGLFSIIYWHRWDKKVREWLK